MEKKSLTKNYLYNLSYQILALILPLITIPYISRTLGAEAIGIYSFTYSIVTYFILFGSMGIVLYGQREIAYLQNNIEKRSKTFYEIIILRTITMAISMVLFYVFYVKGPEYNIYYMVLLLEMVSVLFDIGWFFMGLEDFKKTVIRNMLVKILFVILIFFLVKSPDDLLKYFLLITISNFLGNISLWFYLPKYICKINIKELQVFRHLKPTLMLFIPQIAIQIYTVLDRTMLGYIIADKSEVGFYEQSQKIIRVLITIVTSLGTVMLPRMANSYANGEKEKFKEALYSSFRFVFTLAFPIIAGLALVSEEFVPWFFGEGFEKVIDLIRITLPIVLFVGLTNVIGMQYFITTNQSRKLTISVVCGAIVNFLLNMILIKHLASVGAAIATFIAEGTVLLVQILMIRKSVKVSNIFVLAKNSLLATCVMIIIDVFIKMLLSDGIIFMFIEIILGIFIYLFMLLLLKDELFKNILEKISKKIKPLSKIINIIWGKN